MGKTYPGSKISPDEQKAAGKSFGRLHKLASVTPRKGLARLRYQLIFGSIFVVIIPSIVLGIFSGYPVWSTSFGVNTLVASCAALLLMLFLFRRMALLPGVDMFGQVVSTTLVAFGSVMVFLFVFRLNYSIVLFFTSFVGGIAFAALVGFRAGVQAHQAFYLIPSQATRRLEMIPELQWVRLQTPELPADSNTVLIADLREDLAPEWERLIANAALQGIPVYHVKQIAESLTGRVEIEHLSENSFGSLIPNHNYNKLKRALDLLLALLFLPVIVVLGIFVGAAIKWESPGPVLFRQTRRGYKGEPFTVIKFRTMSTVHVSQDARDAAITVPKDPRITRFGSFLRKTRIDELPQVWNIVRGEMSWIGPRPEALSLSDWYMGELPFYTYRHIVRPGITGWAQVNQGHVADLEGVFTKLHYDFFYIKHLSAGLDSLILARTVKTVFTGFGAK